MIIISSYANFQDAGYLGLEPTSFLRAKRI